MDEHERRQKIRRLYDYRCGYCGVHEVEAGSELEIDHFQPRSADGTDDLDDGNKPCSPQGLTGTSLPA